MIYYLDTSAWIAWKYNQEGAKKFEKVNLQKDTVISNTLFISEYVAFLQRERLLETTRFEDELDFIQWVYPSDPLYSETLECVRDSQIRGADLHHLATALWFAQEHRDEFHFLSCDRQQLTIAKKIGFRY